MLVLIRVQYTCTHRDCKIWCLQSQVSLPPYLNSVISTLLFSCCPWLGEIFKEVTLNVPKREPEWCNTMMLHCTWATPESMAVCFPLATLPEVVLEQRDIIALHCSEACLGSAGKWNGQWDLHHCEEGKSFFWRLKKDQNSSPPFSEMGGDRVAIYLPCTR